MIRTISTTSVAVVIFAAAAAASAMEIERDVQRGPAPRWATIESIQYAGSACPAGSVDAVDVELSGDLAVSFANAGVAAIGEGIPYVNKRKNCALNIQLSYPSGWQFSVDSAELAGHARLGQGTTGKASLSYWFAGDDETGSLSGVLHGWRRGAYSLYDEAASAIWSPCGSQPHLVLNFAVVVDNADAPDASAAMTLGDKRSTSYLAINWRRCR